MQIAQDKQPADQGKEAKRSVQGAKKTRTSSGHHGWPVVVVATTAVAALRLPVVAVFRATLRFARRLMFDYCLFLALKWRMYLVLGRVCVHGIASNSL